MYHDKNNIIQSIKIILVSYQVFYIMLISEYNLATQTF